MGEGFGPETTRGGPITAGSLAFGSSDPRIIRPRIVGAVVSHRRIGGISMRLDAGS